MTSRAEDEQIIETMTEPLQQYLKVQVGVPKKLGTPAGRTKVLRYCPLGRQPLAILTILDDGSRKVGETIRIRDSKILIGRERGNVVIPFDFDMSGRHAELRCQKLKDRFRWYLIDCKSTNGTFVRGLRASLFRDTELILGSRRYLFQLPAAGKSPQETEIPQTKLFRSPKKTVLEQFVPRLTETGVNEDEPFSCSFGSDEMLVGGDPRCQISIAHDPYINSKHARFFQDAQKRWMIEDQKSLNGVWIRVRRFAMEKPTEFQLGQQRFRFLPTVNQAQC
jgi:pSer/pThr/pTyr-binding forkhead associated (FHA) protein